MSGSGCHSCGKRVGGSLLRKYEAIVVATGESTVFDELEDARAYQRERRHEGLKVTIRTLRIRQLSG